MSSTQSLTAPTRTNSPLFALNIQCKIKPKIKDDWVKQVQESQLCSRRDEPDCLQFVFGQDVDDQNTFYLFQLYRNQDAFFQEHCKTPHFQVYKKFVETSQPYIEKPKLCYYNPLEEVDDTTKRPIPKDAAFGLNVNLYPKASVRKEFLQVISNNKKGTDTTEPLALQYTYGEATAAPGTELLDDGKNAAFHFHESYSGDNHGKEGFDAHASAPHFAAWEEFVTTTTDPFDKAPEVYFYHILES